MPPNDPVSPTMPSWTTTSPIEGKGLGLVTTALIIAAVFESAGALIAGGDVVGTISKGIIDPSAVASAEIFIYAMMAALVSSALWVNLATWVGAPVSTTHPVVGGVMGAGIAAAGFGAGGAVHSASSRRLRSAKAPVIATSAPAWMRRRAPGASAPL